MQPVVEVRDRLGRLVQETTPVTITLASGGGEVLGTVTVQTIDGVARFTDLRLRGTYGAKILAFSAPGLAAQSANPVALLPPIRSLQDRPDDIAGPQVHVVYVLPRGATDRRLDTEVDIANSVEAFQGWLGGVTGLELRVDRYQGALDVSFFELSRADSEIRPLGPYIVSEIERQLTAAGIIQQEKRYLIYYDGGSVSACGGAAWPPIVQGVVAAVYLRACDAGLLAREPGDAPGYWEFAALHDLLHTLGVVSAAAPHYTADRPAHVPEPADLMYCGGAEPWRPSIVDINNDDYFGPNLPAGLPNLASSAFVVRSKVPFAAAPRPVTAKYFTSILPVHPTFVRR